MSHYSILLHYRIHNLHVINKFSMIAVLAVVSHPVLPLLALSTASGRCLILNVAEASEPLVLNSFYLIRAPLDRVKFSQCGRSLGVCSTATGKIFILRGFNAAIHVRCVLDTSEKVQTHNDVHSGRLTFR